MACAPLYPDCGKLVWLQPADVDALASLWAVGVFTPEGLLNLPPETVRTFGRALRPQEAHRAHRREYMRDYRAKAKASNRAQA